MAFYCQLLVVMLNKGSTVFRMKENNLNFLDNGLPLESGNFEISSNEISKFREFCYYIDKKPSELTEVELVKYYELFKLHEKDEEPNKTVFCPRCGKEIIFEEHGNSYEIRCSTKGCIKMTFRGI